ncbi:MAG: tryptophan 2,3-dioxygenase family protein [Acidobacteriota bacterium]
MSDTTYSSYLKLDELLNAQQVRSDPPEHDEMLFIILHQTYELWFKDLLHELDRIKILFSANDLFGSIHLFKRVRMILKTLVGQLDILETMTPLSFSSFRDRLDTASGFQSVQFRELEFLLGYKRVEMLKFLKPEFYGYDRLKRRLEEPSLIHHFYQLLEQRGETIPASLRGDPSAPNRANAQVQESLLRLYKESPELAILFEMMTDVDEGMQEWRYRHVKIVERTIGSKQGTGGSPGVEFLKKTLFNPIFPDLWAIRHKM